MVFNSFVFLLIFVPVVILVYWQLAPRQQARLLWLTAASFIFYAYADWRHLLLMILLGVLGYYTSARIPQMEKQANRRAWTALSLGIFLLALGFFKYFDFTAASAESLLHLLGLQVELPLLRLALPLGISFYTFKAMSYVLDLHNGRSQPAPDLLHFLSYLTLFHELIAGPISRYRNLGKQLATLPDALDDDHIINGAYLIILGLAKKVLLADLLGTFVDPLLANHASLGFFGAWAGVLGYSLQLYFDFSGYSDMAVGLGHLFGLSLPRNFNNPYRAENITAFWNRWHITLSHWFRDYIFFPLSRGWLRRTHNQQPELVRTGTHLITMALVGLWHGAAWTFILWGVYHGALLAIFSWLRPRFKRNLPTWISQGLTFFVVVIGWTIFRSQSTAQLGNLLLAMGGLSGFEPVSSLHAIIGLRLSALLVIGLGICFLLPDSWEVPRSTRAWAAVGLAGLFFIALLGMGETITFLYRQF